MKKHKRLIIILSIVAVVIAAIVVGLIILRSNFMKAPVYSVQQLFAGGYDTNTIDGTVYKSDSVNYYLDADKKVKEVFVKEGDSVKKGTSLFKYDTTIMEYEIKEKELDIKMATINLDKAKNTLEEIKNTPVIVVPSEEPPTDPPETEPPVETTAAPIPSTVPPASGTTNPGNPTEPTQPPTEPTEPAPEPTEEPTEEPQEDDTVVKSFSSEAEKQRAINDQQVAVNTAQAELDAANVKLASLKKSLNNATVVSSTEGKITAVQDPEDLQNDKPFCSVSGKATMQIKAYLTEFALQDTKIGDVLLATDYMSGNTGNAEIIKIADFPTANPAVINMGNTNTSYYEMTAVLDASDSFDANASVSLKKPLEQDDSLIIPNVFVRKDSKGLSYVFKNKDGKLTKQEVTTASSTTPGTVVITKGITSDDYIAFPYGDRCKEGALTVETDPWAEHSGLMGLFGG